MEEALTTRHHMLQQHTLTDITTDTNTQKEADGKNKIGKMEIHTVKSP